MSIGLPVKVTASPCSVKMKEAPGKVMLFFLDHRYSVFHCLCAGESVEEVVLQFFHLSLVRCHILQQVCPLLLQLLVS